MESPKSTAGKQMETNQPCACSCQPGTQSLSDGCVEDHKTMRVVHRTTSSLTFANYFDHFLARWGWNRGGPRVEPALFCSTTSPRKSRTKTLVHSLKIQEIVRDVVNKNAYPCVTI